MSAGMMCVAMFVKAKLLIDICKKKLSPQKLKDVMLSEFIGTGFHF